MTYYNTGPDPAFPALVALAALIRASEQVPEDTPLTFESALFTSEALEPGSRWRKVAFTATVFVPE